MSCPHKDGCVLFPLFALKASLKTWQIRYCDADYSRCERFEKAQRDEPVPDSLLPNGKSLPSKKT
ncbi:MAG: hypothetical protein IT381_03065 [Deltaproteobacteria bacterium]|nr:hypothetical protein [Deltaproteobacteria bacterium]